MDPRISMVTLGVSDLEKSIAFYEQGLGFPRMPSEPGIAFFYKWSKVALEAPHCQEYIRGQGGIINGNTKF